MPKIKEGEGWVKSRGEHIITVRAGEALSINIPKNISEELRWKIGEKVMSAKINEDTWLVWKEKEEPELSVIAKPKIAPAFYPIELGREEQEEYLKGGKEEANILRTIISRYILGGENIEITSTELLPSFIEKLERMLEGKLRLSVADIVKEKGEEKIIFTAFSPLNTFKNVDSMYKEVYDSVSEIIELVLKEKFSQSAFDDCKTTVRICEHNCDLQTRMILRNIMINKIDEIDNLPYITMIVKYVEQISDYLVDMIEHIRRLKFEIPEVVVKYAKEFKENILDTGYFIDPTKKDYEASFLNEAMNECLRIEKEGGRNTMEKLEKSNLMGEKIVNSCFLISGIYRTCRNLRNIIEIKYDWQNSSRIKGF